MKFFYVKNLIIFFFIASFIIITLLYNENKTKELKEKRINEISLNITQSIQSNISESISATNLLEFILISNDYNINNFNKWGESLKIFYKNIAAFQLAPNGIVEYIYPLDEHKNAIGHNLFDDEKRKASALKAFKKNELTFVGPLKLIQNNKLAVIARKPIANKDGEFWGFAIVLIYLDDILKNSFQNIILDDFNYALYGNNPDNTSGSPLIISSSTIPSGNIIKYPINVPNGTWHLIFEIKTQKNLFFTNYIFAFLLSLLITYYFHRNDKKKYELMKKLKLEKLKFEKLLDTNLDGIHLLDKKGNVVFCNSSFANMLGYSYEEAMKLNIGQWNNSAKGKEEIYISEILLQDTKNYYTKNVKKDGVIIDINVNVCKINFDGEDYFYASSKDITNLLTLEENSKLLNTLNKTQHLAKIGSFSYDLLNTEFKVNGYYHELFGLKKVGKLHFKDFIKLIHPNDIKKFQDARIMSNLEKKKFELEFRIITIENKIKYVYANWEDIKKDNKIIKIEGYFQDITEKTLSERKGKELSELLNVTQRISKTGSFKQKFPSNKLICDKGLFDIYDLEPSDNITVDELIKYWTKESLDSWKKDKFDSSISFFEGELFTKKSNSKYFRIELQRTFDENNDIKVIHGTIQDITEKVNIENERKKQEVILLHQNKLAQLGELISMIAHQWRQPLTVLVTKLDKLKIMQELDMLDKDSFSKQYSSMRKNVEHMSNTIEDFRNFYKKDKVMKEFSLLDSIKSILELVSSSYRNNNIDLKINIAETIKMYSYESELKQIILSLISNSKDAFINHNEKNKRISISASFNEKNIILKIEDNAGGIPFDIHEKIFEPYFSTKYELNGTGLGLYMTQMLVEKSLSGSIYFETNKVGTVFIITLPFHIKGV